MNHGTIYSVPQDRPPPPPSTVSPTLHQAVVMEIARQLLLQDFLRERRLSTTTGWEFSRPGAEIDMSYQDLERYAEVFSAKGHTIKRTPDGQVDDEGYFYFDDPDAEA